jgi:hypothetical protein
MPVAMWREAFIHWSHGVCCYTALQFQIRAVEWRVKSSWRVSSRFWAEPVPRVSVPRYEHNTYQRSQFIGSVVFSVLDL